MTSGLWKMEAFCVERIEDSVHADTSKRKIKCSGGKHRRPQETAKEMKVKKCRRKRKTADEQEQVVPPATNKQEATQASHLKKSSMSIVRALFSDELHDSRTSRTFTLASKSDASSWAWQAVERWAEASIHNDKQKDIHKCMTERKNNLAQR